MGKLTVIVVVVFIVAAAAGALYLAYGNFPVRQTHVETVLPDARFPK